MILARLLHHSNQIKKRWSFPLPQEIRQVFRSLDPAENLTIFFGGWWNPPVVFAHVPVTQTSASPSQGTKPWCLGSMGRLDISPPVMNKTSGNLVFFCYLSFTTVSIYICHVYRWWWLKMQPFCLKKWCLLPKWWQVHLPQTGGRNIEDIYSIKTTT